jgi:hypothetical protein
MKSEQGRGFENHRATQNPARMQKQGPEPQEQPLHATQIGRSPPRAVDDQKLMFEEETFRHDRFNPTRAEQRRHDGHQMREQRQ